MIETEELNETTVVRPKGFITAANADEFRQDLLNLIQPGREMTRIPLNDILAVVRVEGETGSHRDPQWTTAIEILGAELDDALANAVGEKSLSDLLDEASL